MQVCSLVSAFVFVLPQIPTGSPEPESLCRAPSQPAPFFYNPRQVLLSFLVPMRKCANLPICRSATCRSSVGKSPTSQVRLAGVSQLTVGSDSRLMDISHSANRGPDALAQIYACNRRGFHSVGRGLSTLGNHPLGMTARKINRKQTHGSVTTVS